MHIDKCYKYEKDGIICVGGNLPDGATILETMDILCADDGYTLISKSDFEDVGSSIWLKDGDTMENYGEKKYDNIDRP